MNIGLFFGSFNPIHLGHLIIVNSILNEAELEKVWLIVSPVNPFKTGTFLLNEVNRLEMAREAIAGDPRIVASDVEFELPRPSFTYVTLNHLRQNFSEHEFSVIMGSDSFQDLPKWRNFHEIIAKHEIIIYRRPGFAVENKIDARIRTLNAPLLEISSTQIRDLVDKGKSIRYLVPDPVREIIERKKFYKK